MHRTCAQLLPHGRSAVLFRRRKTRSAGIAKTGRDCNRCRWPRLAHDLEAPVIKGHTWRRGHTNDAFALALFLQRQRAMMAKGIVADLAEITRLGTSAKGSRWRRAN